MARLWFKAKRYGYGWYPCTWEGWLVTLVAIVLILINTALVDSTSHSVSDTLIGALVINVIIVAVLIFTCVKKGEKARGGWGGKD